jgi:hypothetical protein
LAGGLAALGAAVWTGPGSTGLLGAGTAAAQTTEQSPAQNDDFIAPRGQFYSMGQQQREEDESDWQTLMDFMRDNAPNRYAILLRQHIPFSSPVRRRLLTRWRTIETLKDNQSELYPLALRQLQVEDRVIGLAARLRRAEKFDLLQNQDDLKAQIHSAAEELVQLDISQREIEVRNAQRALAQQQDDLTRDKNNQDQLITERYRRIVQQAAPGFQPPSVDGQP